MEEIRPYKVCVNGSRTFNDYIRLAKVLDQLKDKTPNLMLILGGAIGADKLAEQWATKNKIPFKLFLPDWNTHGKKAGILRNMDMINESQELISFWDGKSKGTKQTIEYANSKNIPITIEGF